MTTITTYLESRSRLVEEALSAVFPRSEGLFARHIEAMRYSLLAGGKRIRPILCLAAAESVSEAADLHQRVLPVACALECIHTYSLIHDDLPAMDNDDLRRGRPTNHKVHGEAGAILAGDGLLTFAFELLAGETLTGVEPAARLRIIHCIARAAGPFGMVGGQALDIAHEGQPILFEELRDIHEHKTGALLTAAVQVGAMAVGCDEQRLAALTTYGRQLGLAFQIVDDLLNATSTTEQLGKAAGSDVARGKATYPAFFGLDGTRARAAEAVAAARQALNDFDAKAEPLRELADYVLTRAK
ncbi:MAG: farnesyl-diphosphate synthase [Desulfobulbaceae bacterium A2]|nr:MAG: farnesyl-diphosphate synthase [Desulfobulbaceae bacterium A2]